MAKIPFDDEIVRRNEADFKLLDDRNITGGLHIVATGADRDAIQTALRKAGMLCLVQADGTPPGTVYQLQANLTTWLTFSGGGGGGLPPLSGFDGAVVREGQPGDIVAFQRLTYDDIDPAFSITSFVGSFGQTKELGDNITDPAFTAAYNAGLSALTIDDGAGPLPITLPGSANAFAYDGGVSGLPARGYVRTAINAVVTWLLAATKQSGPTRTASVSAAWRPRVYYDIVTVPGSYNQAFITALTSQRLQSALGGSYAFGAGAVNKRIYIAWPNAFGSPSSIKDQNGFTFPMSRVATAVAVTNGFAVLVAGGYDIWASDNFITSTFTLSVS